MKLFKRKDKDLSNDGYRTKAEAMASYGPYGDLNHWIYIDGELRDNLGNFLGTVSAYKQNALLLDVSTYLGGERYVPGMVDNVEIQLAYPSMDVTANYTRRNSQNPPDSIFEYVLKDETGTKQFKGIANALVNDSYLIVGYKIDLA